MLHLDSLLSKLTSDEKQKDSFLKRYTWMRERRVCYWLSDLVWELRSHLPKTFVKHLLDKMTKKNYSKKLQ